MFFPAINLHCFQGFPIARFDYRRIYNVPFPEIKVGVSENVVYPIVPTGFADHYPYEKWLCHWEYTIFSDKPKSGEKLGQLKLARCSRCRILSAFWPSTFSVSQLWMFFL